MSTATNTADLDALRAQVAALEAAQKAAHSERAAEEAHSRATLYPEGEVKGFAGARLKAQNELRDLRERAAAEVEAQYQRHLAGSAQKRARIEKQLADLASQRRDEEERHREAIEALDGKVDALRRQHDGLFRPPVTIEQVLAKPEFVAEQDRIVKEEIAETLPIGLGLTVESVLNARRRMVGVRG